MKILIPFIFLLVSCSTTTTHIKNVENYNDNKVLQTNNSIARIEEPRVDSIIKPDINIPQGEEKIDYYDLFYKIGVIGLVILGGSNPQ